MKSIAAKMVAVTIALGASSAACAAVNLHGEA
ncbi:porin, partial [Klebsiella pneumoniae]